MLRTDPTPGLKRVTVAVVAAVQRHLAAHRTPLFEDVLSFGRKRDEAAIGRPDRVQTAGLPSEQLRAPHFVLGECVDAIDSVELNALDESSLERSRRPDRSAASCGEARAVCRPVPRAARCSTRRGAHPRRSSRARTVSETPRVASSRQSLRPLLRGRSTSPKRLTGSSQTHADGQSVAVRRSAPTSPPH